MPGTANISENNLKQNVLYVTKLLAKMCTLHQSAYKNVYVLAHFCEEFFFFRITLMWQTEFNIGKKRKLQNDRFVHTSLYHTFIICFISLLHCILQ